MIPKEEVIYAYRLLFGREPENEAVVAHYATELADWRALRELFINSPEFRNGLPDILYPRSPHLPFNGPPMAVELSASPEKLAQLFAKTSAQWQHLGETEPHWSVLTNESYFQKNFSMNRAAFYASGKSEVAMFEATLNRAGVSKAGLRRCVELGCGVGRVTAPLAGLFPEVVGVDISAAHLQVARAHLDSVDLGHVECRHLDAIDAVGRLGDFDVLYSRIVLQHNPPPVMARLLEELLARLRPGGIAFFQIPTYKAGYSFRIDDYLLNPNLTNMEMHFFPQAALFALIERQGCRLLELREDDAIGISVTAISNTVLIQKA